MAQDVVYKLIIDASGAHAGFEQIKAEAAGVGNISPKVDFSNLSSLNDQLAKLKTIRDNAFDFSTAKAAQTEIDGVEKKISSLNTSLGNAEKESHGFFSHFKEGFGSIATIGIGTALGEGIKDVFSGFIDKAREAHTASLDVAAGISRTGLVGEAASAEITRLGGKAEEIASQFALPKLQVTELQAKVAGFSGQTGPALDKLVELSLGAASALQLPAESVARMIARAGDPEQAANLSRLGIQFEKNATLGEKMALIEEKFGPAIDVTKAAAQSAVGDFDRLKNTVEEAAIGFASNSFEALQPVFNALIPVVTTLGEGLISFAKVIGDVAGFAVEHKTAILLLVGAYVAFRAVSAVSELGGLGAIWTKANGAVLEYLQNLLGKLIPGLGAQVVAEEAVTVAEGEAAAGAEAVGAASAIALGPIGLLLGLAAAGAAAFVLFGNHTKDAKTAIEDTNKALTDFNEANKHAQEVEVTAQKTAKLSDQYSILKNKANLTKDETVQLSSVTKELNDATGGAAAQFDNYGNLIGVATEKVKALGEEEVGLANQLKATAREALDAQLAGLGASLQKTTDDFKNQNKDLKEGGLGIVGNIKAGIASFFGGTDALVSSVKNTQQDMQIAAGQAAKTSQEAIAGTAKTLLEIEKSTGQTINNVKDVQTALKGGVDDGVAAQVLDRIQSLRTAQAKPIADIKETPEEKKAFTDRLQAIQTHFEQLKTTTDFYQNKLDKDSQAAFKAGARKTAELTTDEQKSLIERRQADIAIIQKQALNDLSKIADENGVTTSLKVTDFDKDGNSLGKKNLLTLLKLQDQLQKDMNQQTGLLLKFKPVITENLADDVNSALNKLKLKEIEFGIRPPEDITSVIDDEIGILQGKIERANDRLALQITTHAPEADIAKTRQEIANFEAELIAGQEDYNKHVASLNNVLRDSRIAALKDDKARERETLDAKFHDFEDDWARRIAFGRELSQQEQQVKLLGEEKYQRESLALNKKIAEEKYADVISFADKGLHGIADSIFAAFDTSKKMSDADYKLKVQSFDKDQAALVANLRKGQITQHEYNLQLAKINQDRSDTEKAQNANVATAFVDGLKKTGQEALSEAEKWLADYAIKKATEAFINSTVETTKVADITAGATAQSAALLGTLPAHIAATAATLTQADATIMLANVLSDPLLGLATGAAQVIALEGIMTAAAVNNLKGFQFGGVLINEMTSRPEIIAPYKEFAAYSAQLIAATVQATQQSMKDKGDSGSGWNAPGSRASSDKVVGKLVSRGRDVTYQLERESLSRKSETITFPASTGAH